MVSRRCDLAGVAQRRGALRCWGYGRFHYTGMTGDPAKIIASANGCILPPLTRGLQGRADAQRQMARSIPA